MSLSLPGDTKIFTDSLSSLRAIQNRFTPDPLIREIQAALLHGKDNAPELIWIPAHMGLDGNELADKQAKSATSIAIIDQNYKSSLQDLKRAIQAKITRLWDEKWSPLNSHLHQVRREASIPDIPLNRREQVTLTRLRIVHFLHNRVHLLTRSNPEPCPKCRTTPVTTSHFLLECPQLATIRADLKFPPDLRPLFASTEGCLKALTPIHRSNLTHLI